jgi:hypothetical protein
MGPGGEQERDGPDSACLGRLAVALKVRVGTWSYRDGEGRWEGHGEGVASKVDGGEVDEKPTDDSKPYILGWLADTKRFILVKKMTRKI